MPEYLAKLFELLSVMENILVLEKPVMHLWLPCMVVGDLHGNKDWHILFRVEWYFGKKLLPCSGP